MYVCDCGVKFLLAAWLDSRSKFCPSTPDQLGREDELVFDSAFTHERRLPLTYSRLPVIGKCNVIPLLLLDWRALFAFLCLHFLEARLRPNKPLKSLCLVTADFRIMIVSRAPDGLRC